MLTVAIILTLIVTCCGNVIDLSGYEVEEFKSEVDSHDAIFIKFFAPYCMHCKSMASDFVRTSQKMSEDDTSVTLAEVDCTSATGTLICQEYKVGGYPTLKLFKNGVPYKDYNGNRTADEMAGWLKKNAAQHSKRVSSFTDLDKTIETADEPVVIAVFENYEDNFIERWERAAKKVKNHWQFRNVQVSLSEFFTQSRFFTLL